VLQEVTARMGIVGFMGLLGCMGDSWEFMGSVRLQAERLLDHPAARLVGGGAYEAVVGDREIAAVGGAQGEDAPPQSISANSVPWCRW
jgi:hypothetical protein